MSTKINDDSMSLEIDGRVIATAEFSEHAAADGHGAWIVSCHPGRLFTRNQAITAMVLAERLAAATAMRPVRDRLARGAGPVTAGSSGSRRRSRWWPSRSSPRSSRMSMPTNWCARTASPA